ncbi:MAG: endonuclease/exonuclease/phosphatase family protein [Acidobacteriota bacterium]|nr:endonuclease/exonuclease/phosphatase family protein [Acidobacteriota bacterium]
MKRLLVALLVALSLIPVVPAHAAGPQVTVMTRNLYLGSDVGVAMDLIPNLSAAAQFMWDQVKKTDFNKRAPKLAAEVIAKKPDVVGLQEATIWFCKKNVFSKRTEVFNFTKQFLAATKAQGTEYVLAQKDGITALNTGYSIAAVPFVTMVNDPEIFQPLFGQDKAACGFEIADALAIRADLADKVLKVGNTEYEQTYTIVPTIMTIYRGYTWADIQIGNTPVRFVTTHLESLWDENKVPNSAIQAQQLIADLKNTKNPVVVMGDFNSDPRDPRMPANPNPGEQPVASDACPAGTSKCNAYLLMTEAGFTDSGPDPLLPENYTWGMNALLTGPDPVRLKVAKQLGNNAGYTDRLDYVFVKNGVSVTSSGLIGATPPNNLNTDHAGIVATLAINSNVSERSADLPEHAPFPISFWQWVGIAIVAVIIAVVIRKKRG